MKFFVRLNLRYTWEKKDLSLKILSNFWLGTSSKSTLTSNIRRKPRGISSRTRLVLVIVPLEKITNLVEEKICDNRGQELSRIGEGFTMSEPPMKFSHFG